MRKWPNGSRCLASYIVMFGPLPLFAAKHIFYQLVDAVAHLHSKGITHCDIKPENILIDANTFQVSTAVFCSSYLNLDLTFRLEFIDQTH